MVRRKNLRISKHTPKLQFGKQLQCWNIICCRFLSHRNSICPFSRLYFSFICSLLVNYENVNSSLNCGDRRSKLDRRCAACICPSRCGRGGHHEAHLWHQSAQDRWRGKQWRCLIDPDSHSGQRLRRPRCSGCSIGLYSESFFASVWVLIFPEKQLIIRNLCTSIF